MLLQYDAGSTSGYGSDDRSGAGINPRRLRLGIETTLIWDAGGKLGGRSRLYQASLAYTGVVPFVLTAGVFKPHSWLEEMQPSADTMFLERAAVVSATAGLAAGSGRVGAQIRAGSER